MTIHFVYGTSLTLFDTLFNQSIDGIMTINEENSCAGVNFLIMLVCIDMIK